MNTIRKSQGPWHHRALIWFFSVLLGLLIYWLLGFIVNDIGTWPGPRYEEVEGRLVEPSLRSEAADLERQLETVGRTIGNHEQRQRVLRDSTDNSARTMNQLLEIQRLNLQKGITPGETEQTALRDAQQLFLTNQQQYQQINDQIATLAEQRRSLEEQQREVNRRLETQRQPAREDYQRLYTRHQLKLAALKLSVLVPLLLLAVGLFLKYRSGLYAPAIYALGIATLAKVLVVMHQHFPRRYFKYVLIVAALLLVGRILVYLLKMIAFPKRDWLLKQHREAYEHFFCPVCSYPIRRGPLKHAFWTRRSLKRLAGLTDPAEGAETAYVCPVCSTRLFEECPSCHGIRHSLLPACTRCGTVKQEAPAPQETHPTTDGS